MAMGRPTADSELGPYPVILSARVTKNMAAALATRALIEGVDRGVIARRLLRIGAQVEGIDVSGLGLAPMPVDITTTTTN